MNNFFSSVWTWIRDDWRSHPTRFIIEVIAWALSIGCAFVMAITVPTPPLKMLYPLWLLGCSLYAWAAWTRRSFGMLVNYVLMVMIDFVGLINLWF